MRVAVVYLTETIGQRLGKYALLPVRLALAAVFMYAGWKKLLDVNGTIESFEALGMLAPGITAPLVAIAEFFGGLGLAVGFLPRFSAAVLTIVMLQATWVVYEVGRPFMPNIAFNVVLVACVLAIALGGPGKGTLAQAFHAPWLDPESLFGQRILRGGV